MNCHFAKEEQLAKVKADLLVLIARARAEGKWIVYRDDWNSPDEFVALNVKGLYIFAAENFTLRDPQEHLRELEANFAEAQSEALAEIESVKRRIAGGAA